MNDHQTMKKFIKWMDNPAQGPEKWLHGTVLVHRIAIPNDDAETANTKPRAKLFGVADSSQRKAKKKRAAKTSSSDAQLTTPKIQTEVIEIKLRAAAEAALEALAIAEAGLADIGDADREPGDDVEWCERRAAKALPATRDAISRLRAALEEVK